MYRICLMLGNRLGIAVTVNFGKHFPVHQGFILFETSSSLPMCDSSFSTLLSWAPGRDISAPVFGAFRMVSLMDA